MWEVLPSGYTDDYRIANAVLVESVRGRLDEILLKLVRSAHGIYNS